MTTDFLLPLLLAILAATTCFDARPGVNWALWVIPAAAGLYYFVRGSRPESAREIRLPLILACVLSAGAAVTANEALDFLIVVSCVVLLATSMRIAAGAAVDGVGAGFIAASPVAGALAVAKASWDRSSSAMKGDGSRRSLPVIRGIVVAIPIVAVLWLLLSAADPHLDAWAAAMRAAILSLEFVPRLVFGVGIFVLALGAYALASREGPVAPVPALLRNSALGATERIIVLGAVAALFAVFVLLQVPAYFGNPAAVAGNGVTYAEWARRGFGELATAAALVTLLIVMLDALAERGTESAERIVRTLALVLVALTLIVTVLAFRRVSLYEAAYSYTSMRIWAQAFMLGVAAALVFLALELTRGIDPRRLARRCAVCAGLLLAGLTYWNYEAFIVRENVRRFGGTEKLDVRYLAMYLSADAMPELVAARSTLPAAQADRLTACLAYRWEGRSNRELGERRWYEFNLRSRAATAALPEKVGTVGEKCGYASD